MNKTLLLFKTMFRSEDVLEINMQRSGRIKGIFKVIGLILLLLLAGVSFAPIIAELYPPFKMMGMQDLLLKLLLFGASFIVLIFGFFYVMSVFYYSSDIENYLYLPIKPGALVLAKFMIVAFYEVISTLAIFYPSFVVFGVMDGQGPLYYLKVLLTMIILPIAPLAIMAILCMILMRFSKLFRNKDRFTLLSSLVGIFIALSMSSIMQRLANSTSDGLPALLQTQGTLFNVLSAVFPATTLMHRAIFGSAGTFLLYTGLALAVCGAFIFVFYQLGNMLYIDGAKGLKESGMRRKSLSVKEMSASTRRSSAMMAIAVKEMRLLLRTPPYFLNCILVSLIMPVFFIFPVLFGGDLNELATEIGMSDFNQIRQYVKPDMVIIGIMALMAFYAGLNLIAATAITREGSNFSFMKYIPVPYRTQLMGKLVPAMVVELAGVMILLVPAIILLRPAAWAVAAGIILGLLLSLALNFAMLSLDIVKPVLTWTTEQKAVKNNFNAMISSFGSMVAGALPVVLYLFVPLDKFVLFAVFFVVLAVLNALIYRQLPILAQRSFQDRP